VCLGFASTAFTNSSGVPTSLKFGCGFAALCSLRPSVKSSFSLRQLGHEAPGHAELLHEMRIEALGIPEVKLIVAKRFEDRRRYL
jgi:hypothetical protein